MKRFICYALAVLLHLAVLFGIPAPAPRPPEVKEEKKYLEVTLVAAPPPPKEILFVPVAEPPPAPPPPPPIPPSEPPSPPVEQPPPPSPEPPPVPVPVPSSTALALPVPAQTASAPAPIEQTLPAAPNPPAPAPVAAPSSKYVGVSQPSFQTRAEPDYPLSARRQHQQGTVTLELYINELGTLDHVEVVKSSGYPVLDDAAVEAMKQSIFHPAYQGATPVPSHAEITINFTLQD